MSELHLESTVPGGIVIGMTALDELKKLPIAERLQLVEDLWDSIAADQNALPDPPELIEEIRARVARFKANPSSGIPWEEVEKRILAKRG
jgi:putative addiction module component (TIGR02574 family)